MKRAIWLIVIVFVFFSCAHEEKTFAQSADVPDHEGWTALLKNHVDKEGLVDYKGFLKEKSKLIAYTQLLAENPPADNWTRNEALTYLTNP